MIIMYVMCAIFWIMGMVAIFKISEAKVKYEFECERKRKQEIIDTINNGFGKKYKAEKIEDDNETIMITHKKTGKVYFL